MLPAATLLDPGNAPLISFLGEDTIDDSTLGPLPDGLEPFTGGLEIQPATTERTAIDKKLIAMADPEDTWSQKGQSRFVKEAVAELCDNRLRLSFQG